MKKEIRKQRPKGIFLRATDEFAAALEEASKAVGLNKQDLIANSLALAFPAYFVGRMPPASTRQNTRAKIFDDHRETKNAGKPSDSFTVASPEPASCFGEGVGSAASCFADLAGGFRYAKSEDLAAEKSREARPR